MVTAEAIERLRAGKARAEDSLGRAWGRILTLEEQVATLRRMLREVEWVRQAGGSKYACAFCRAICERDGGPGHLEECEWRAQVRELEELEIDSIGGK